MKTGTVKFLPVTFLTDVELSSALASSPDELAREAAHRLAKSAKDLDRIKTAYAAALVDIGEDLAGVTHALADVMDTLHPGQSAGLDRIHNALEALSTSVSEKEEEL